MNIVTQFVHSALVFDVNMTGRCKNHFRMKGSHRRTFQAKNTSPIPAASCTGTVCAGWLFKTYSLLVIYIRSIGTSRTFGKNDSVSGK